MKICAWTIAYLLNCILFILSGSGFKKRANVFAVFFMYVRIRNTVALKSSFCKTVWDIFENSMSKPFEEIRLKRLFNTSGNFDGVEFIIFYRFEKHKRRIVRNRPGILFKLRVGNPNGVRVVSLWKKSFCVENRVKKAKKSMEIIEMHTLVKIATFWTLKNLPRPQRALWGTVEFWSNNT